jgi:lipopolysaccharide transport system ATP-binding protein
VDQSVVVARGLGKRFRRYNPDRPWTFQEWLASCFRRRARQEYFWSLRNLDFTVDRGRTVGIVGPNGAGKSTLLRLLAGIGRPDAGTLQVNGRLSGLLSLGAGFHSDLTGRENVFVTGVTSGLTKQEVAEKLDEIVEFAELAQAIDAPLRTYSTGMQMRLAFAVAIHVQSDILLVDEVLAVGDQAFQRKCLARIDRLKQSGCTIIIVSHDSWALRELCDEVIWLEQGRIRQHGPADDILTRYSAAMNDSARLRAQRETISRTPQDHPVRQTSSGAVLRTGENRFGSMEMHIADVQILDRYGVPSWNFNIGDLVRLEIEYEAPEPVFSPIFGVAIVDSEGQVHFNANTPNDGMAMSIVKGRGMMRVEIEPLNVGPGTLYLDIGIYQREWSYAYDYHSGAHALRISGNAADLSNQPIQISWSHQSLVSAPRTIALT